MDLKQLDTEAACEAGAWLQFKHPVTREPLAGESGPWRVQLLGRDSKQVQQAEHRSNQQMVADAKTGKVRPVTEYSCDVLAAATLGFENVVEDGKPVTAKDAARLYRHYSWMRRQADAFMNDLGQYLGESNGPSNSTSARTRGRRGAKNK